MPTLLSPTGGGYDCKVQISKKYLTRGILEYFVHRSLCLPKKLALQEVYLHYNKEAGQKL